MHIHQGSDFHLEFGRDLLEVPGGADILVLNGDIMVPAHILISKGSPLTKKWKMKKLVKRYEEFFKECSEKYPHVLYVFGNHEYYYSNFHTILEFTRNWFKEIGLSNITILDNSSVVIDGIKFFGSTLWTDMRKSDPMVMWDVKRGMNDCSLIQYYEVGTPSWITPQNMVREHDYSIKKLKSELSTNHPTIVVSHHGPTYKSIPNRYRMDTLSFAYVSDLSDLILDSDNLLVWFHGHTHDNFNYQVGNTQVICNPRGYFSNSNKKVIRKYSMTDLTLNLKEM